MDRCELLRKMGSLQQVAYIRPLSYAEGRSAGLRTYEVKNDGLYFKVLADKCLDIGELSYRGVNFSFLSKPGLQGRNHYDTNGQEALRSIMGGMFFTAGLENICAPYKNYPMHGRIRTTPAEHLCSHAAWESGDYIIRVSGEMREAELFGENLVLRRQIETCLGQKSLTVADEIENQGFCAQPLMILYHINIGYPLLDEGTELLVPTGSVIARDKDSVGHEDRWNVMDAPKDNEPEYVFIHDMIWDRNGCGTVCVINSKLALGLKITFSGDHLPYFMEWKSIASGDYVLGLEPANASVYGRAFHEKENSLHYLAPFAVEKNKLIFTVLEGKKELDAARAEILKIKNYA